MPQYLNYTSIGSCFLFFVSGKTDAEKPSDVAEKVLPVGAEKLSQLKLEANVKVKEFLKASPALESYGERVLSPLRLKPEPPGDWMKVKKDNRGPPGMNVNLF